MTLSTMSGRKDIVFYLTMHSTHFIYGYIAIQIMKEETSSRYYMGYFFLISSKGSFKCTITDKAVDTTAFVTPVVDNWLE